MCNLYSLTSTREAIRALVKGLGNWSDDKVGNMPPLPGIFPDGVAPVVRKSKTGREMLNMRWAIRRRHKRKANTRPMSGRRPAISGSPGLSPNIVAWYRSRRSANTIGAPGKRSLHGSRWRKAARCFSSPASGAHGRERAGRRRSR